MHDVSLTKEFNIWIWKLYESNAIIYNVIDILRYTILFYIILYVLGIGVSFGSFRTYETFNKVYLFLVI